MAHVNLQVRDKFVDRIETIQDLVTVSTQRSANLADAELPAAVVSQFGDEVEAATKAKGLEAIETRSIDVGVTLVADGADENVADVLTGIRAKIETAVAIDADLGGLAYGVEHTGMELDLLPDEDGQRWYAVMVLSWTVTVMTILGDPETAT